MSRLGFALAMLGVVAAAAWTYHINYETKQALTRVDRLRAEIAAEREAVEVLRVEWAYLNAPDRLARLVARNNDRLGLVPMDPGHFGDVAAVPFPPRPPLSAPPAEDIPEGLPAEPPEAAPEEPLLVSELAASVAPGLPVPVPRPGEGRAR